MSSHVVFKKKQIRLKRRRVIVKLIILSSVILSVFVGVVFGLNSQSIRISNVMIQSNSIVSNKDIQKEVTKILSGDYFLLFPRDNIFIYPKQQIEKEILSIFKRIYNIDISTVGMHSIEINIKDRLPVALWCGNSINTNKLKMSDKCYFLDKTGFIFDKVINISNNTYFKFYGKVSGNIVGNQFLPKAKFESIIKFKDSINNTDIKVDKFSITKDSDYIFYVDNSAKTIILFNKVEDTDRIFSDLKSAIEVKTAETRSKNIFRYLKYIDLRFDNKVIFKF